MQLKLVHPSEMEWDKISSIIADACEYNNNRYSADDVKSHLEKGTRQLWIACDDKIYGLAVTQIAVFPRKKCLVIDICTGTEVHRWLHYLKNIEDWGRSRGCKQMLCAARAGFSKFLTDYHKTHIILEKEL